MLQPIIKKQQSMQVRTTVNESNHRWHEKLRSKRLRRTMFLREPGLLENIDRARKKQITLSLLNDLTEWHTSDVTLHEIRSMIDWPSPPQVTQLLAETQNKTGSLARRRGNFKFVDVAFEIKMCKGKWLIDHLMFPRCSQTFWFLG